ncbi:MAG: glycerophosphodiester phosphodiesterase family protein [Spirochaetia bacterium]
MSKKNRALFPFAHRPLLFGHRGCSIAAPENTMPAFQRILDHQIPGVELDVHICKTGELVVTHDRNLQRVTGLDSLVEETEYETIAELDAGSWFGEEFRGEKVPLLDDVFDLLGDKVYYDIEIKHRLRKCGPLEKKLVDRVKRRGMSERVMLSSFNPFSIKEVRRLDKTLLTAVIYSKHKELPWIFHNGEGRFIGKPHVLKPSRHKTNRRTMFLKGTLGGYPIIPWTIDEVEEARNFLSLGVSGIISDIPEKLLPLLHTV